MSNLGLGVMINMLGGNEDSVAALSDAIDQTISDVRLEDDKLWFEFDSGYKMTLSDEGQSCCEHRYMQTDDNLSEFIGSRLRSVEIKDAPSEQDEYGSHEVQFLEIMTDHGCFTMASHNEHNGYYGGFWVVAKKA